MKNAITKSLDDPVLEAMQVVPTDRLTVTQPSAPIADLISQALHNRPELAESDIDLVNRQISRSAARNALLPSLSLVGFYGGFRSRRAAKSRLQSRPECFDRAGSLCRRAAKRLQQHRSRLLRRPESEPSYKKSSRPFRWIKHLPQSFLHDFHLTRLGSSRWATAASGLSFCMTSFMPDAASSRSFRASRDTARSSAGIWATTLSPNQRSEGPGATNPRSLPFCHLTPPSPLVKR